MKLTTLFVGAILAASATFSASADDLVAITTVPAGGTVENYDRSGTAYYKDGFSVPSKEYSSLATELVTYPDGTVYWKNPVSQVASSSIAAIQAFANVYIQGTISGNTMTFNLPQYVGQGDDGYGNAMEDYVMMFDKPGKYGTDKSDNQVLTFTKNAQGDWVMNDNNRIVGLGGYMANFDMWVWQSFGDYNVVLSPATAGEAAITIPDGAVVEQWAAKYDNAGKFVDVCVLNNEIYVRGLFPNAPKATFKGTIADGLATFETGEYIGQSATGSKVYFAIATQEEKTDPENDRVTKYYAPVTSAQFAFDAAARCLTIDKFIMATENATAEELNPMTSVDVIDSPVIAYQPAEISCVPATPTLDKYSFKRGEGQVRFTLPAYNVTGQLLNTANLYYRIFINNTVLEFSQANGYNKVTTPMTFVPYDFDDAWDFEASGASHQVYLYQSTTPTFVGVQAMYKVSDTQWESSDVLAAFGTAPADLPTGIESVVNDSMAPAIYYDLQGRRVENPQNGIFILRQGAKAIKVIR